MARRGLGKGLDTLISAEAVKPAMKEETVIVNYHLSDILAKLQKPHTVCYGRSAL